MNELVTERIELAPQKDPGCVSRGAVYDVTEFKSPVLLDKVSSYFWNVSSCNA
jgi:hypothetical protein